MSPRLLTPEEVKLAFSTNAYSGPMNPTFMKMESYLPASKVPIARASRAGVAGTGGGSSPTRGGFLLASRQEAPVIPMKTAAADKPKKIMNGDHLQYILDKERGDGVDRGKLKEKDSGGMDQSYWPYNPGDFKPAKLASAGCPMEAILRAFDRHMMQAKLAASPTEALEDAQHVATIPNALSNRGSSVREVALPKMLTTIGTIARAPVAAVDKGGKY